MRALAPMCIALLAACEAAPPTRTTATDEAPALPAHAPAVDLSRMVAIPAGTFPMGHAKADPGMYGAEWKENELPQHVVTLSAFYIDRDEVTSAAYADYLAASGAARDPHQGLAGDRPIAFVSWNDAAAYCAFVGKSLPTEAEWERAAKGPTDDRRFPWGDDAATCSRAVFTPQTRCEDAPAVVGSRSPAGDSPEGVHDLAGNVAEWVNDVYGPYVAGAVTDPPGPEASDPRSLRVVRGGGLVDPTPAIRTTARFGADPDDRSEGVGFRCVYRP